MNDQAPKVGCLATFILAAFLMWPLTAIGVPDKPAFALALVVALIGVPAIYAARRRDQ